MSEQFIFQEAERKQLKARVGFCGPAGSGKTTSALIFATVIVEKEGGEIFVIDTENGSAALYADEYKFRHLKLTPPYSPIRLTQAMDAAVAQGATVIIVDGLSPFWSDEGGVLDIKDKIAARSKNNDSFSAWREATPEHARLVNALVYSPVHIVATMRTKQAYVIEQDDRGKNRVRKLGMQPVQREGLDYEFTIVADVDTEQTLMVSKSRCKPLARAVVRNPDLNPEPTFQMARTFYDWLQSGAPASKFADWPWLDILVDEHGEADVLAAINETRASWTPPGPPKASLLECVNAPADFQKAVYDRLSGHDQGPQGDDWSANGQGTEDVGTEGAGAPEGSNGTERTAAPEETSTPSQQDVAEEGSTPEAPAEDGTREPQASPEGPPPLEAASQPQQQPLGGGDGDGSDPMPASAVASPESNGNGSRERLVALMSNAVDGNINLGRGRARASETYIVTRYGTAAAKKDLPVLETFDEVMASGDEEILAELAHAWELEEKLGATV